MGRSAGTVTLRFEAGTAGFVADVDKAKAKIREFGAAAGTHGVSGVQAASGAIRTMEGNVQNNVRAVERFLVTTLKMGPVLQAAFPIVGAVAFGGMIAAIGKEVNEFFKDLREGPEKVRQAFRELNAPLRLANDELAVTNDRLANDIAKLEGRHQNTLKLALDEARVAADKLADALDKDLESLNKILKEQHVGFMQRFFGTAGTSADEEDIKQFGQKIAHIDAEGTAAVRAAKSKEEAARVQEEWNKKALNAIDAQIGKYAELVRQTQTIQDLHEGKGNAPTWLAYQENPKKYTGYNTSVNTPDQSRLLNERQGTLANLQYLRDRFALTTDNTAKTNQKSELEAGNAASQATKPFRDRMNALNAELEAANAKLGAAGMSSGAEVLVKAYGEAVKAIAEVNKELEQHHRKLTEDEEQQIKNTRAEIGRTNADAAWQAKMSSTNDSIQERIRQQQALTDAVGKGYEAQRRANIETQVVGAVGIEAYSDPSKAKDVAGIRKGIASEVDAAHTQQGAAALDALNTQIKMQTLLTEAQKQGEEEVRRLGAMEIVRAGIARGATGQEIQAEISLFYAKQKTHDASEIAKIQAETAATQKLSGAMLEGAEAARKQALENKYAEMVRSGQGAAVPVQRAQDEAARQSEITGKVAERLNVYRDELAAIDQERDKIIAIVGANAASIDQARVLRNLEDDRLRILVQQQLAIGNAKSGLHAFFLEMQTSTKKVGEILYGSLMSAVDRTADALSKLLTGQKANFGEMLRGIGQDILRESLKAGIQKGLGKIGELLGITKELPKPTGRPGDPVHVWLDNLAPGSGQSGNGLESQALKGSTSSAAGWLGVAAAAVGALGGLFGGHGGGEQASDYSMGSYYEHRASGGTVNPSQAYIVGERGPELLTGASGRVLSNAAAQRAFGGGGSTHYYTIDARGTDPVQTEQRVYAAIRAAHQDAVSTSVRATVDRGRRVPRS